MKQVLTLTILICTATVNVFPFIPAVECDMPCCQPVVSCCNMDEKASSVSMTQCETVVFVPMISAPLFKHQLLKELPLDGTPVVHQVPVAAAVYGKCPAQEPEAEPPPSFLFPLLI